MNKSSLLEKWDREHKKSTRLQTAFFALSFLILSMGCLFIVFFINNFVKGLLCLGGFVMFARLSYENFVELKE